MQTSVPSSGKVCLFTSVSSLGGFTLHFYTVTVLAEAFSEFRCLLMLCVFFPELACAAELCFHTPMGSAALLRQLILNLYIPAPPSGYLMRCM